MRRPHRSLARPHRIRLKRATERLVGGGLFLFMAACGGAHNPSGPPVDTSPAGSYTAIGASETVGIGADHPLQEAWPQVFYRTSLPRGTVFTNLGIPGATVASALRDEVGEALELKPTLATVWLNVNDIVARVPAAAYEPQLRDLVHRLRRGGTTTVLVANTPAIDRLPAYLACRPSPPPGAPRCSQASLRAVPPEALDAEVDAYNAAIGRVTQAEGAVLVDLHAASLAARGAGTEASLVAGDGFHPSTAGHAAVATAFAAALPKP